MGVKVQSLIDMHDSFFFKWDGDLKAFIAHLILIACGSVSRQVCASFRPYLVPKKFSAVAVTSNLRAHAWNIKCS